MDYDPMLLESRLPYPKSLDETVWVARAQEQNVLVPEFLTIDGGSSGMETAGGMEAAPFDLRKSTFEDGGDAKTESAENDRLTALTRPDGEDRVTEQQHGGSDGGAPAGGSDEGADAKAGGEKKRKRRSKKWGVPETEMLLKAILHKKKSKNRSESEPRWEAIGKEVPGRPGQECRRRMETLKKSYTTIRNYCDDHKKEFWELKDRDFRNMKPATELTESWFSFIRDHCPPKPRKKRRDEGGGSSLANGVRAACASGTGEREVQYRGVESTKVVETTPDQVMQSKRALEACEVVAQVPPMVPEATAHHVPTWDAIQDEIWDGNWAAVDGATSAGDVLLSDLIAEQGERHEDHNDDLEFSDVEQVMRLWNVDVVPWDLDTGVKAPNHLP